MKCARWACVLSPSFPRTHTNYTHTDPFARVDNAHAHTRTRACAQLSSANTPTYACNSPQNVKQPHLRARTQAVLLANINTHARVINNGYFYSAKARVCARTRTHIPRTSTRTHYTRTRIDRVSRTARSRARTISHGVKAARVIVRVLRRRNPAHSQLALCAHSKTFRMYYTTHADVLFSIV